MTLVRSCFRSHPTWYEYLQPPPPSLIWRKRRESQGEALLDFSITQTLLWACKEVEHWINSTVGEVETLTLMNHNSFIHLWRHETLLHSPVWKWHSLGSTWLMVPCWDAVESQWKRILGLFFSPCLFVDSYRLGKYVGSVCLHSHFTCFKGLPVISVSKVVSHPLSWLKKPWPCSHENGYEAVRKHSTE